MSNKRMFCINNGSYDDKIIVSVGGTFKEVFTYWQKIHNTNDIPELDKEDFDGTSSGMFDYDCDVLWLKDWKNNKEWNDTLRHECHHICHYTLGVRRSMLNEPEALAYHQDYLINTIRKLLNKKAR